MADDSQVHLVEARLSPEGGLRAAELHLRWVLVQVLPGGDRWVPIGRRPSGRPPVLDSTAIPGLQAELGEHLRSLPGAPSLKSSVEFIVKRLGIRAPCDDVVLEQIVRPVHQKLWPNAH
jgi:hypothetical protein